jgi:hypothetical protein
MQKWFSPTTPIFPKVSWLICPHTGI